MIYSWNFKYKGQLCSQERFQNQLPELILAKCFTSTLPFLGGIEMQHWAKMSW